MENGFTGSEADWLASIKGDEGTEGKSAYELYCELFGYEGTEEQWLIDWRTGALISFNVTFDLNGGEAPEGFVSSTTVRGGSFNKCFATSNITYREAHYSEQPIGVGCFVGLADNDGALSKNYYTTESKIMQGETDVTVADTNATAADLATLQSSALLVDELGWNPDVWEIVDGQYPTLIESK